MAAKSTITLLQPGKLLWPEGHDNITPIDYIVSRIKGVLPEYGGQCKTAEDRIFVIQAGTGSGKSTFMPPAILRIFRGPNTPVDVPYTGKNIICTQPRVLTSVSIASNVGKKSATNDLEIGVNVGYQTGPLSERPPKGLIYMTIGVLNIQLKLFEDSMIMDMYKVIIIDEVHERSIESDMTLMRLANFYNRNVGNAKLPILILTSATIDFDIYTKYFGITKNNYIQVIGNTPFPVIKHWPDSGVKDYNEVAVNIISEINKNVSESTLDEPGTGDILMFVPSMRKVVVEMFTETMKEFGIDIFQLDRGTILLNKKDYRVVTNVAASDAAFREGSKRWLIVSTSVAETGITLPSLKYVIDPGWQYSQETYFPSQMSGLIIKPCSKAKSIQRAGRVGRISEGHVYPLYTQETFEMLQEQQESTMLLEGILEISLDMVYEQQSQKQKMGEIPAFSIDDLRTMDTISVDSVWSAYETMFIFGYVSNDANNKDNLFPGNPGITKIGNIARKMSRMNMSQSKILLSSFVWGAYMGDLINIVATYDVKVLDLLPSGKRDDVKIIYRILPEFIKKLAKSIDPKILNPKSTNHKASKNHAYDVFSLIVNDECIEKAFLMYALVDLVYAKMHNPDSALDDLWNVIDKSKLRSLLSIRDDVIEDLMVVGINPYMNRDNAITKATEETFFQRLMIIKQCIYDGRRNKLLVHGGSIDGRPFYNDRFGNKIWLRGYLQRNPLFSSTYVPKYITAGSISVRPIKDKHTIENISVPLVYENIAEDISVLDGYVVPDINMVSYKHVKKGIILQGNGNPWSLLHRYKELLDYSNDVLPEAFAIPEIKRIFNQ